MTKNKIRMVRHHYDRRSKGQQVIRENNNFSHSKSNDSLFVFVIGCALILFACWDIITSINQGNPVFSIAGDTIIDWFKRVASHLAIPIMSVSVFCHGIKKRKKKGE